MHIKEPAKSVSEAPYRLGWRPALDGLRALAVIVVLLYHFNTRHSFPGGQFGVDLFFALSGFLITTILISEWRSTGDISLIAFYRRRAFRLLPAVCVFISIYSVVCLLFHPDTVSGKLTDKETLYNAGYGLTYVYNLAAWLGQKPGGFNHLWSLSVEEQYYLLWPALLCLLLRLGVRPAIVLTGALVAFGLWCELPLFWHTGPGMHLLDWYGAPYRLLLLGSCAGFAFGQGWIRAEHVRRFVPQVVTLASAALLVWVLLFFTEKQVVAHYRVMYPLLALACVIVVVAAASVTTPGLWMSLLGNRILVYIGKRSYAIYLWHFPIGDALKTLDVLPQLVVAGALTLLVAELSYRLIEAPALRFGSRRPEFVEATTVEAPARAAA